MQALGVFFRKLDPNFTIRNIEQTIHEMQTNGTCPMVIFIPDVRYQDEACWIIEKGGIVIRLTRTVEADTCETETQLDNIPETPKYIIIDNQNLSQADTEIEALRIVRKNMGI
jgi:hypothetical protein